MRGVSHAQLIARRREFWRRAIEEGVTDWSGRVRTWSSVEIAALFGVKPSTVRDGVGIARETRRLTRELATRESD